MLSGVVQELRMISADRSAEKAPEEGLKVFILMTFGSMDQLALVSNLHLIKGNLEHLSECLFCRRPESHIAFRFDYAPPPIKALSGPLFHTPYPVWTIASGAGNLP